MSGISVKLPLSRDDEDGLALNKSYEASVRQNLKNLILTIPGERPMISDFGVGLIEYLFENDTPDLRSELQSKIYEQVGKYMPFVNIRRIDFANIHSSVENFLGVFIQYEITPLGFTDNLALGTNGDELQGDLIYTLNSVQRLQENDLTNTDL